MTRDVGPGLILPQRLLFTPPTHLPGGLNGKSINLKGLWKFDKMFNINLEAYINIMNKSEKRKWQILKGIVNIFWNCSFSFFDWLCLIVGLGGGISIKPIKSDLNQLSYSSPVFGLLEYFKLVSIGYILTYSVKMNYKCLPRGGG